MKIGVSDHAPLGAYGEQPPGIADALQVELFQAALNAPAPGAGGADNDASREDDADGTVSPLAYLAKGIGRNLAGISNDWQQAQAMAADIGQRDTFDGGTIRDIMKMSRTAAGAALRIELVSKVGGKVSHTADVMSRG
ncbi:hypothetical protein [Bordetella bronchialis]|uniref:Uncharacterized protein n=1 Tax=Bordetella bronchialis TaxID=463025 RepID=A0A193G0A5_9BORD|nr:hypothetical protein [Bordetella bronchialis]ANN68297.1 hypothetical protein BAU06_20125 [Bordetella bronchialis]ANN73437.1 hypothetical protein BAU08_20655 [Bordetella bronchialis]